MLRAVRCAVWVWGAAAGCRGRAGGTGAMMLVWDPALQFEGELVVRDTRGDRRKRERKDFDSCESMVEMRRNG